MLRHGESAWNKLNLFTGWVDIPLSPKGIQESLKAGKLIKDIPIDIIISSPLMRAQMTAFLAMSEHSSGKTPLILHPDEGKMEDWAQIYSQATKDQCIPVLRSWELNERMYGKLQGLNKAETMAQFGKEQVQIWRRSFDVSPPEGESLAETAARAIPYFKEQIIPLLEQGRNVFISAHGNSLRAIIMYLDDLNKEEVVRLEIATGLPIIYNYHNETFTKEENS